MTALLEALSGDPLSFRIIIILMYLETNPFPHPLLQWCLNRWLLVKVMIHSFILSRRSERWVLLQGILNSAMGLDAQPMHVYSGGEIKVFQKQKLWAFIFSSQAARPLNGFMNVLGACCHFNACHASPGINQNKAGCCGYMGGFTLPKPYTWNWGW